MYKSSTHQFLAHRFKAEFPYAIFIEHQHTDGSVKGESSIHWQPRMYLSLRDVVTYITKHDEKLVAEHIVSEENQSE